MNKYIALFLLAIAMLVSVNACKKKAKKVTTVEVNGPLKAAIAGKNMADTLYKGGNISANFGLRFYPLKSGKITKLGCRMPETGTYAVSLWDFDSARLLATININIGSNSDFTYASITPVNITANKKYVISVNTFNQTGKPYFQMFKKPTPAATIYPCTSGNIVFDAPLYKGGSTTQFPDYNNASDFPYLRGLADFEVEFVM